MYKNEEGKWVNGSAAKAKYHLQVRCNSKMMEMTSYYLNELCGDGTPPHEIVMTAPAKINEKGEKEIPKKTRVKKYSFTYAMAFERFSQGKGLVSRYDRSTLSMLDKLIGLVRQILPMSIDDETTSVIKDWQNKLREVYNFVDEGQKPVYLTDKLGCLPEQLQAAMKTIYKDWPDEEWRIDEIKIIRVLIEKGSVEKDGVFVFGNANEKDRLRDMWRKEGKLELDTRYNIRMSSRFPAEEFKSEMVRGWLEWICDVPVSTHEKNREDIAHDIEVIAEFIKEARRYPRTIGGKKKVGTELRITLNKIVTNANDFIINRK